jgi:type I restriction enzyme, S subunit
VTNNEKTSARTGWVEAPLQDFCQVTQGQSPPGNTYNAEGDGLPFFQGKAEFGDLYPTPVKWCSSPTKLAERDDILISIRAPVGPTNLSPTKACIGRGLAAIRPLGAVSVKYVLYALRQSVQSLLDESTGSTFDAISGQTLREHVIPLAPIREQAAIVAEIEKQFTRLDAAVAALKRVQANLKRYRAAVLKAACEGRLVATEAELARREGRFCEPTSVRLERILEIPKTRWETKRLKKLNLSGKTDLEESWKNKYVPAPSLASAPLPRLPEGWTWATTGQVGDIQVGRQRSPKHHSGTHMRPYLRVANVFEDRIDTSDVLSMNFTPSEFKTFELKPGDILLNEGQSLELVGRAALYRGEVPGACFQNTLIRFRPHAGVDRAFALLVFRSYLHNQRFQKIARWTTNMAHLGAGRLSEVEFPLPPLDEQLRIVAEAERRLSIINETEKVIKASFRRAISLRQSILKQAFDGRLVQQNPSDEPVSILLNRISAERTTVPKVAPSALRRRRKKETKHVS